MVVPPFTPTIVHRALAVGVLAVAKTRIEGAWAAYVAPVKGINHKRERDEVLRHGGKLPEALARELFPQFKKVPYAH